jgi:hypothetical protein
MNTNICSASPVTLDTMPTTEQLSGYHCATVVWEALQNVKHHDVEICISDGGKPLVSGLPDSSSGAIIQSMLDEKWLPGLDKSMLESVLAY